MFSTVAGLDRELSPHLILSTCTISNAWPSSTSQTSPATAWHLGQVKVMGLTATVLGTKQSSMYGLAIAVCFGVA